MYFELPERIKRGCEYALVEREDDDCHPRLVEAADIKPWDVELARATFTLRQRLILRMGNVGRWLLDYADWMLTQLWHAEDVRRAEQRERDNVERFLREHTPDHARKWYAHVQQVREANGDTPWDFPAADVEAWINEQ